MNGAGKGVLFLIGTPGALMAMVVFLVLLGFGGDDASACTTQGAPVSGYVDPEAFFAAFGVTLCGGECRHASA